MYFKNGIKMCRTIFLTWPCLFRLLSSWIKELAQTGKISWIWLPNEDASLPVIVNLLIQINAIMCRDTPRHSCNMLLSYRFTGSAGRT